MKVKKVEISAFRIYDDPKDATFDLTTQAGNAAGFVSLYAPNGFGKTSFYDAVEYGVTESVDRFYMRADELEKMANAQSIDKFIRNTNSNRSTYVKIYTDGNNDEPTYNRQFYKHGNQRHDLILESRRRKEHSFQKVILSQEWISAFLTESDGETRYRKFMSNPELSSVDNYYNNLRHLLKALWKKKSGLEQTVEEFKKTIQTVSSENTLEKVNSQIQLLKNDFNQDFLELLSLEATQEQAQRLQDTVASLLISQNKEEDLRERLHHVTVAKSGNEIVIGINLYYTLLENQSKDITRLSVLTELIQKFDNLDQHLNSIENKKASLTDYNVLKSNLEATLKGFEGYTQINAEINNKDGERKNIARDLYDLNAQTEILNRRIIENKSQIDATIRFIEENTIKKTAAPEVLKKLEKLDADITKTSADITEKRTEAETKEKELSKISESTLQYERILHEIDNSQYPQITSDENNELFDLIQKIKSWEIALSNKHRELKSLEASIADNENLNRTITDFIQNGLTIVHDHQSSSCPLCEHMYESYEALVAKISGNQALNKTIKTLLEQKNAINTDIGNISVELSKHREQLYLHYNTQLDRVKEDARTFESSLNEINILLKSMEDTLGSLRQERENLISSLNGISPNDYISLLDKNILELISKRNDLSTIQSSDLEKLNGITIQIDSLQKQTQLLSEEIKSLNLNDQYLLIVNWFKENTFDEEINKATIIAEEQECTKKIAAILTEIKDTENTIDNLKKELNAYSRDNLNLEKAELGKNIEETAGRLNRYQNYVKDNLKIDTEGLNKSALDDLLGREQNSVNSELDLNKRLLDEYQKLNSYCQNIWAFLQSETEKKKANDAQADLDILSTKVEPKITAEFESAKEYLETKIKNFFHVDLINDIYKKIDPHPDFKSVEFKASFEAETPRLDVFVRKINDDTVLVPNLYFSTAQINILSLSIFLASALKETEYKCIFIDDPIQSMDNINVLSTIDLLRSIVVNEDRQIILSTHDENFHNLLKKKMPPELFESKFLELESFGKVKQR